MKLTVEINDDAFADEMTKIIVDDLRGHYNQFSMVQDGPFRSLDESAYNRKMLKALKRVIKFYGGDVD